MTIAIDFDGTIVEDNYPQIGKLKDDAKFWINSLHEKGHYIIIWTCRKENYLVDAINFLIEQGIKFDRVNDNHPDNNRKYGSNSRKVYADVYVDDRQVGELPCWLGIHDCIMKRAKKLASNK